MVKQVANALGVGTLTQEPRLLKGGSVNRVWQLTTAADSYVLKQLIQLKPDNDTLIRLYRNTQAIAHVFLKLGIPAVPARIASNNDVLLVHEDAVYMLFPYVTGEIRRAHQLSVEQSVRIAICVAMMHKTTLKIPAAEAWQFRYDESRWQALIQAAPGSLSALITALMPDIQLCYQVYEDGVDAVQADMVIAHRDLHAPNMLWTSALDFQMIDWDLAGQTPAATDLLYTLFDCCLEKRVFNANKFTAMLCAYMPERDGLTELTEAHVNAVLLNWLSWVLRHASALQASGGNMATKTLLISEIRHSLLSYQVVRAETRRVCDAWNAVVQA